MLPFHNVDCMIEKVKRIENIVWESKVKFYKKFVTDGPLYTSVIQPSLNLSIFSSVKDSNWLVLSLKLNEPNEQKVEF